MLLPNGRERVAHRSTFPGFRFGQASSDSLDSFGTLDLVREFLERFGRQHNEFRLPFTVKTAGLPVSLSRDTCALVLRWKSESEWMSSTLIRGSHRPVISNPLIPMGEHAGHSSQLFTLDHHS
jgi:hypothetical protein